LFGPEAEERLLWEELLLEEEKDVANTLNQRLAVQVRFDL
jgi:hypothetical protein